MKLCPAVVCLLVFCAVTASGQQVADPSFDVKVAQPANKPARVLLDEAHYNFHTAAGRYQPFAAHAITRGRNAGERINRVQSFTGQSLKGPSDSVAFLKLADTAVDLDPATNKQTSAAGRAQGIALQFGKGRVVVMGEAAMLSAQLAGPQQMKMGMNQPGLGNKQLVLNLMHWLTGILN